MDSAIEVKASTCHTDRRKAKEEGKEVATNGCTSLQGEPTERHKKCLVFFTSIVPISRPKPYPPPPPPSTYLPKTDFPRTKKKQFILQPIVHEEKLPVIEENAILK
jgi:hypothetical protein